ncbi:sigma factor-like helix-turn-helix DNA-binding protein [Nonomuraea diastatica]|uniref:sigma factor-like helix-turn-helix DNA-binding protein n=1 Tax=Nonomuraea diastatica TaxID=1848329 RepID=UPI001FEA4A53|nr:sigma factor-like helix-turn-helix DNA-binding protein [Nonomuraea diastatica]
MGRGPETAPQAAGRARAALLRGLSDQEIADILGVSRATVRSQWARALDKLRIKRVRREA